MFFESGGRMRKDEGGSATRSDSSTYHARELIVHQPQKDAAGD